MKKKCHQCLELKVFSEFHICKSNSDGLQIVCKLCRKQQERDRYKIKKEKIIAYTYEYRKKNREKWLEYTKEYRKKNKEIIRIKKILKEYNLTNEEYEKMFLAQGKRCAICKQKDFMPKIDHDHKTGKIRGILCFNCNCALGGFKDDVLLLKSAIFYLKNDRNRITYTQLPETAVNL